MPAEPEVRKLMMMTVVRLNKNMIEKKKIISLSSNKPCVMLKKWVSKLKEAIISIIETGANSRKKDKIYSKPQSMKTKLAITAKTNAVT